MKKKVFYYTSAYFMDVSVELIQALKAHVDLYVFIEVTNSSKTATILNINTLPSKGSMFDAREILDATSMKHFSSYFEGTKAVNFVVHNYPSFNIFKTYTAAAPVRKMIKDIQPDVLHLEGYTLRTIGLFGMFGVVKKLFLAVHDSQPHSGMKNLKVIIPRYLAFRSRARKTFVFYSQYSKNDFVKNIKHFGADYLLLQLYRLAFLKKMLVPQTPSNDHILFFGRIAAYKGLDLLLDAMPKVWERFPDEKLMIAGGGANEQLLSHPLLAGKDERVVFYNRFIPTSELAGLINKAKFVVCPYRDATQSGVLVSSFAFDKPVLATDVGAFSEQLQDGITGKLITSATVSAVAETILGALEAEKYKLWQQQLEEDAKQNKWDLNAQRLITAYNS